MKICPKCNKKYQKGLFCTECGNDLIELSIPEQEVKNDFSSTDIEDDTSDSTSFEQESGENDKENSDSEDDVKTSKASHCQKCGAKFNWWWRHRHICSRCNKAVCDACSENMVYTPERVHNLNFEKKELCNDCKPVNAEELEKEKLIDVIKFYEISYKYGLEEKKGVILPAKEEFFRDIKNQPAELILASEKGYKMGVEEAKRREERKQLFKEAAQSLQKELQKKEGEKKQLPPVSQREEAKRQLPMSQGQERRCSICGLTGHNAQTCPEARRCSICNGYDHDARNCPNAKRRCSICESHAHDARTCPHRKK